MTILARIVMVVASKSCGNLSALVDGVGGSGKEARWRLIYGR